MEKECSPVAVRGWTTYPALLVIILGACTAMAKAQAVASSPAAGTVVSSSSAAQSQGTNPYAGSVVQGQATTGVLSLSLDEAIQRGLKQNLGIILSGTSVQTAGGQKLQDLQALLPTVGGYLREAVQQTNLQAQGIRGPGIPAVIGPYGYTDLRGTLSWQLINVSALQNYLASKHNFEGAKLSAQDARDMVTLTVGNAYLLVISDAARIRSVQAQVDTSKVSLDQAVANHEAGISPMLDELRARVDYQSLQQSLITSIEPVRERQDCAGASDRTAARPEIRTDRPVSLRRARHRGRRRGSEAGTGEPQGSAGARAAGYRRREAAFRRHSRALSRSGTSRVTMAISA